MSPPEKRRPTISEVARAARVAQSTVSRVLNNGYVSSKTRTRVERAVEKLGYVPSATARNFGAGKAGAVGLVVEDIGGEWLTGILKGLEGELHRRNTSLLLCSTGEGESFDDSLVRDWIATRRVDGLMFVRPGEDETDVVSAAAKQGLALALIGPDKDFGVGQVLKCGNVDAGRDVGRHLAARGHRSVAFVGGPRISVDTQDRLTGLREGLAEAGVHLSSKHVQFAHYNSGAGCEYARKWLAMVKAPTAVVLGNDAMALGFMHEVLEAGWSVPGDVSVVGFDDIASAAVMWPGLTTARQEAFKMGSAALRSVLRQIEVPREGDAEPIEFRMPLILRQSTAQAG